MSALLRRIEANAVPSLTREAVDADALAQAGQIIGAVRERGEAALREYGERFGDIAPGATLVYSRDALHKALSQLDDETVLLLRRTAERIRVFAEAQKNALAELTLAIESGHAGHAIAPVERAACYAPGGRYPLVSSVLMTAIPARVAGVDQVWVASPKPLPEILAAAAVAGADNLLAVGGAQAIAALAYGAGPVPACDVIVGPGNRFVTAAKKLVVGKVAIDLPAGPSELVVLADAEADPALIAADLLAQAEHDPDALPVLVSLDEALIEKVERELARQLADLPTADTARRALTNGFAVVAQNTEQAIAICDRLAPEHLQIMTANAEDFSPRLRHYGALFIGAGSAEVLGDYGAGPNHALPTGGAARFAGGLSVFHFLRVRTWLHLAEPSPDLLRDAAALARLEGLRGHEKAALIRRRKSKS